MNRRLFLVLIPLILPTLLASSAEDQRTWTGFITDTHCGTHCQMTSQMKPDLHCVRLCVKRGSKYGLWADKKVYELEPQIKAAKFAAESVEVKGTITGETIHISSIRAVDSPGSK